mgnify:FL=1
MVLGSFFFKQEARRALRGNWQPALVVTFFSGVFLTLSSVLQALWVPDPVVYASYGLLDRFWQELTAVSQAEWAGLIVVNLLSLLFSPALMLGCNRYFLNLLVGRDSGVREGLLGRMGIWPKALWLYVQMGVRIFLWSLLLVVPGILAAIRYSMAPYFMAQDPSVSASEAIEKSKHAMKEMKLAYFSLIISFIGWSLLANVAQMLLMSFGVVIALVAAQFMQVAISAYMNAACASFFLTVSSEDGMNSARRQMRDRLRQMGMDDSAIDRAGFGEKPADANENPGGREGDGP